MGRPGPPVADDEYGRGMNPRVFNGSPISLPFIEPEGGWSSSVDKETNRSRARYARSIPSLSRINRIQLRKEPRARGCSRLETRLSSTIRKLPAPRGNFSGHSHGEQLRSFSYSCFDRKCQTVRPWLCMKKRNRFCAVFLRLFLLGAVLLSYTACGRGPQEGASPKPIPSWVHYPSEGVKVLWNSVVRHQAESPHACREFIRCRPVNGSNPVPHASIPQHPFMAPNPGNNMHCDASLSDTYEAEGPRGLDPRVHSRTQGFGGYGTIAFDPAGRLVAVYSNGRKFQLEVMDPNTLEELGSMTCLHAPGTFPSRASFPGSTSARGCFLP